MDWKQEIYLKIQDIKTLKQLTFFKETMKAIKVVAELEPLTFPLWDKYSNFNERIEYTMSQLAIKEKELNSLIKKPLEEKDILEKHDHLDTIIPEAEDELDKERKK